MEIVNLLSAAEKKRIRKELEKKLEAYRLYKIALLLDADDTGSSFLLFDNREAVKNFCDRIDQAVEELPQKERFLIGQKYLSPEGEYLSEKQVYTELFNPPVSAVTYSKIRDSAMFKLAFFLGID